ncbi:WD40-repeat containing protein [Pandoravirus macleodensis]|uniref:WD40-repeat containing protein n=1 Tax=Pandoravirus macleodensis TaxID=2107707 RepID=A0A2U7UGA1_9VIRU|nr:WD40-repeat containing protein [Pandoravirus macleodensis]AVK77380.1 WD40-repeat containing protein [Pandoravirus macleodensis]
MALVCDPLAAAATDKPAAVSMRFTQDQSCLAVATSTGFSVWNTAPFALRYKRDLGGGIALASALFRTNLIALVGGGPTPCYPPDRVMLWDDYRGANIAELRFNSPVRGVEIVRNAIAVALDDRVYVYDLSTLDNTMRVTTASNPRGLVDIRATDGGGNVLVTLSTKVGTIEIHRPGQTRPVVFRAHEMPIARMTLNADASLLATISEKGTVVRVWDTATGDLCGELRRGKDPASANGLCFSADSKCLCLSTDRGTVHVFDIDAPAPETPLTLLQYIGSSGMLGAGLSQYTMARFSTAQIHGVSPRCLCAFGATPGQALVADADGVFSVYDTTKGGEARVLNRFLFGAADRDDHHA